jgi:hypothetical protein
VDDSSVRAGDPFAYAGEKREHPSAEYRRFLARLRSVEDAKTEVKTHAPACAECGGGDRDLHPVPDDHLTFSKGDVLCEDCAGNHGVL